MKLLFATDLHGSDLVFDKCLRLLRNGTADVVLLGGDLAGKGLVPILQKGETHTVYDNNSRTRVLFNEELNLYKRQISGIGLYPYVCDEEGFHQVQADSALREQILQRLRSDRLADWARRARFDAAPDRVLFNLGNDDPFYLDDVLRRGTGFEPLEYRNVALDGSFVIVSCGYTNMTPWQCPRDVPEDHLRQILRQKFDGQNDMRHVIANLHCPPLGTTIDRAPLLDSELRPIIGVDGVELANVGSTAVRWCIEHYQPVLALHGHIHEAYGKERIGDTLCVNPGSSYHTGELRAALVHINRGVIEGVQLVREH